jgi:hypothetical protein
MLSSGSILGAKRDWPRADSGASAAAVAAIGFGRLSSAKSAGLQVVITPSQYTAGEDFTEADILLPDLRAFKVGRFAESKADD